ncbi:MAG TPA: PA2169 family four-helix-bundle protein [Ohtaekwangia sp.]
MKTDKKVVEILNDLIRINRDRAEGYEKAANAIEDSLYDAEIKTVFHQLAEESQTNKTELSSIVQQLGGEPATDTTASGKLYRVWMDVRNTFSGDDTLATLRSCEYGEDAAQKAYRDALEESIAWPSNVLDVINSQQKVLKASHDRIKRYRDEYKASKISAH